MDFFFFFFKNMVNYLRVLGLGMPTPLPFLILNKSDEGILLVCYELSLKYEIIEVNCAGAIKVI